MKTRKFDLIITDIHMPGMSGMELISRLRKQSGNINVTTPIVACTADVTSETLQEITDSGINDIVMKPVSEKVLIEKVVHLAEQTLIDNIDGLLLPATHDTDEKPYNLSSLMTFIGDDQGSLQSVLSIFVTDTEKHIDILNDNITNPDEEEIHAIVHKMSNMFTLIKAHKALVYIDHLNKLNGERLSPGETRANLQGLIDAAGEVVRCIEQDIFEGKNL
jgi:CheY-like chemotaxis protein